MYLPFYGLCTNELAAEQGDVYFYTEMCIFEFKKPSGYMHGNMITTTSDKSDKNWPKKLSNAEYTEAGRMILSYLLTCAKDGTMKYKSMYTRCLC